MRGSQLVAGIAFAGGTALSALTASAADLPAKTRPALVATPAPIVADWSGLYLGGNIGWGGALSRGSYNDFGDIGPLDLNAGGGLYGLQAGYNWQVGHLVYGVEVDGTLGSLEETRTDVTASQQTVKTDRLASARFRSGAAIDNVYIFGSVGIGYAQSKFTSTGDIPSPVSRDFDGFGIASGFGAEYALTPNWSLRAEYIYYAINKRENLRNLTDDSFQTDFIKLDGINVVRVAANYRFNGTQNYTAAASSPTANWSGFYAGAHGGYGQSRILGTYREKIDTGSFDMDPAGAIGGLQVGYNMQSGAWVYGLEADGSWSGMSDDRLGVGGDTEKLKTTALASVRGRIGVAGGNKLYYVTGGWGYVKSKFNADEPGMSAEKSFSSNGFVFGSGFDWALDPNWSVRVEGLTYLVDKKESLASLTSDSNNGDFARQSLVAVVRAGINYRFGGP
jgi:outer membrane immunogenic protein